MGKVIGSLRWQNCVDCIHDDLEKGGCALDSSEWQAHMEGEHVVCDSFQKGNRFFKVTELKQHDRIKVTYTHTDHTGRKSQESYTGRFRGQSRSSDRVAFAAIGEAIWVTTDQGVETFTDLNDLLQIERVDS